jgi:hypothetical protein
MMAAFWNTYLKGDRQAKLLLVGDGLAKTLGDDGKLERRQTAATP